MNENTNIGEPSDVEDDSEDDDAEEDETEEDEGTRKITPQF